MDTYEQEKEELDNRITELMTLLDTLKHKMTSEQYLHYANRLMKLHDWRDDTVLQIN
jgi:hypothetical protein